MGESLCSRKLWALLSLLVNDTGHLEYAAVSTPFGQCPILVRNWTEIFGSGWLELMDSKSASLKISLALGLQSSLSAEHKQDCEAYNGPTIGLEPLG
jgi:hypothetical protein